MEYPKYKNDIGKPWRFEEEGQTVTRASVWSPPGCHPVGCGVKFYVDTQGKLTKIEGDENCPTTNGRLCVRCLAMKQYIYNPSRVTTPMKRAREDRGLDKWEPCTWDEAYSLIAEKTRYFTEKYGAESIILLSGTGRSGGISSQKLAHRVLGTPNACYTQSGYACDTPRMASAMSCLGIGYPEIDYAGGLEGTYDNPEFVVPEVLILWGKEPLPSNGDGLFGHAVIDLMKRGANLITIDPRVTWVSTRAIYNLRLRPGTDAALGMAMLNIIATEDLYDHDFVENWCYGFDEMVERCKTMPPEKAAEICGLNVDDIYAVARTYANAKPASIAWGLAIDQNQNGVQAGLTILSLMAITGNIDIPGGQIIGGEFQADTCIPNYGWNRIPDETRNKIIGLKEYPYYIMSILNAHADLMLECLETDRPYKIHMVCIQSTNLLTPTNSAQPRRWHDALVNVDWGFGTDVFITPSIQACCEVFLPLATVAEKANINTVQYATVPVQWGAESKCIQVGEAKADEQIMFELGKIIHPEHYEMYDRYEDYVADLRMAGAFTYEEMQEKVYYQPEVTYRKHEKGLLRPDYMPGFNTSTGRFELWDTTYQNYGDDPLPYFFEPPYSPMRTPELMKDYPFVLTTGARAYAFFHSEQRQVPWLRELNPNPLVEIHPDDALKIGVADGQWVQIENQFGKAKLKAKITPAVFPGLVHAQHGWWYPEEDGEEPNLFGVWRSNINDLVPTGRNGKLGFGAPYKCGICNVIPLTESYDTDMQLIQDKFGLGD